MDRDKPSTGSTAEETSQHLDDINGIFGLPDLIVSVHGTPFTSSIFNQWCKNVLALDFLTPTLQDRSPTELMLAYKPRKRLNNKNYQIKRPPSEK